MCKVRSVVTHSDATLPTDTVPQPRRCWSSLPVSMECVSTWKPTALVSPSSVTIVSSRKVTPSGVPARLLMSQSARSCLSSPQFFDVTFSFFWTTFHQQAHSFDSSYPLSSLSNGHNKGFYWQHGADYLGTTPHAVSSDRSAGLYERTSPWRSTSRTRTPHDPWHDGDLPHPTPADAGLRSPIEEEEPV